MLKRFGKMVQVKDRPLQEALQKVLDNIAGAVWHNAVLVFAVGYRRKAVHVTT